MKSYDSYIESGIKWLGKVPSHWAIKRGKYVIKLLSGFPFNSDLFSTDESDMPLIRIRDIMNTSTESFYSGPYPSAYIIKKGDVLVGMDGDFNVAIWNGPDGLLNQRVCKVVDMPEFCARYASYVLPRPLKCINDITYSTTVKHLSTFDIYQEYFPVPPMGEQKAIADYLDAECKKIDILIAKEEKRISLLDEMKSSIITRAVTKGIKPDSQMKDSGVFWIGNTPKSWTIKRLRFTGQSRNGLTYKPTDICSEGEGILVIRSSNIQNNRLSFDDNVYVNKYDDRLLVNQGDVIICSRNGSLSLVGKSVYIDSPIRATFGAFMLRYRSCENKEYAYYMVSTAVKMYKGLFSTTTVNQLVIGDFKDMVVSVPPIEEQRKIVTYIKDNTSWIEKRIDMSRKQIDLLREYKQSLITEVVTGKRRVC